MKYVKQPRGEPTNEEFIALVLMIGPLAWPVCWIWRGLKRLAA